MMAIHTLNVNCDYLEVFEYLRPATRPSANELRKWLTRESACCASTSN